MPLRREWLRRLDAAYWWIVAVAAIFTLARFSEAFLILRAQSIGLSLALVPTVLVLMSLVYSLSAYPIGILSDRMDRVTILVVGLALLVAADLVLAFATGIPRRWYWRCILGTAYGLYPGPADNARCRGAAPAELRGTAFGMFNLICGLALLAASVIAGALWDATGPQGTFAGAAFAALTIVGLLPLRGRLGTRRHH